MLNLFECEAQQGPGEIGDDWHKRGDRCVREASEAAERKAKGFRGERVVSERLQGREQEG